MPAYSTTSTTYAIAIGDSYTVWSAESPTTGTASKQVAIVPNYSGGELDISVSITFSGAPGAFQCDLQTADADVAAQYVSQGGASMVSVNAGQTANLQWKTRANFARLMMTTQPANSVTVTGTISR